MGCGSSAAAADEPTKEPVEPAKPAEDATKTGSEPPVIDEDMALMGFLADLEKVPIESARAALLTGEYADKRKEIEAMTDAQVMEEFKNQSMAVWAEMGTDEEKWDEMLSGAEKVANDVQEQTEAERKLLSPKSRAVTKRRLSIAQGLSEENALAGFLAEIDQLPADVARSGLLGGSFQGQDEKVAAMSDAEVAAAYKEQSMEMWEQLGNESETWDEKLSEAEKVGEAAKESLSPETRANRTRRKSISDGLSEDQALAGFMAEIESVTAEVARTGLLEGAWLGKDEQVTAMSDEEVHSEYKKQSLEDRKSVV